MDAARSGTQFPKTLQIAAFLLTAERLDNRRESGWPANRKAVPLGLDDGTVRGSQPKNRGNRTSGVRETSDYARSAENAAGETLSLRVKFKLDAAGVPCSAFGCAEACAIGSGVGKSSIHDVRLGNAKNQFVVTDSGGFAALRYLPFIGGSVKLAQLGENVFRKVLTFPEHSRRAGYISLESACVCRGALLPQGEPTSARLAPHRVSSSPAAFRE